MENAFETNGEILLGKTYPIDYKIKNSGNSAHFCRFYIQKYFTDSDGNKTSDLPASLIELGINEDDWLIQDSLTTDERIVIYYKYKIFPGDTISSGINSIKLSDSILKVVDRVETTDENGYKNIDMNFMFNKANLNLKIEFNYVQDFSTPETGETLFKEVWGANVTVSSDCSTILSVE